MRAPYTPYFSIEVFFFLLATGSMCSISSSILHTDKVYFNKLMIFGRSNHY